MNDEIEQTRRQLRSEAPRVVVEAPAGCGKTYEAVALACDTAANLPEASQVLLLTHTHAAKDEFARRAATTNGANRVRISTLDSFLLEMCAPHTAALGLPHPLQSAVASSEVPFSTIAEAALQLVLRSPFIAKVVGTRYPMIILDEHQDASSAQHGVVESVGSVSGARLRFFGDPMQAIYGGAAPLDWSEISRGADAYCTLAKPWRWGKNGTLGAWIQDARLQLSRLQALPQIPKCAGIELVIVPDVGDPGYSSHFDVRLTAPVRRASAQATATVLTYTNKRAEALTLQMGGSFTLNEGAEFKMAREAIRAFCDAGNDAQKLAILVVRVLSSAAVGFDQAKKDQCHSALGPHGLQLGRKKQVAPIVSALADLYARPSAVAACRAVKLIFENPPEWITRWKYPRNLRVIASVGVGAEVPQQAVESLIAHDRHVAKVVSRTISTIHKAKGLEYESVLLWNFSSADFPMEKEAAKRLYVALSRASEKLTLVAPGLAVSPFAPLPDQ